MYMALKFTWDSKKANANVRKHKVNFSEAETVFYDDSALIIKDLNHSATEERFILLGMSINKKILLVIHCYRENDLVIRIISARKASKSEQTQYYERSL